MPSSHTPADVAESLASAGLPGDGIGVEGTAGVLRVDGHARLCWKAHQQPETEHHYERGREDTFGGGACDALQAHVVRHLREGAPLESSGADCLANMRIMEAVYASHEAGRRIEIAKMR